MIVGMFNFNLNWLIMINLKKISKADYSKVVKIAEQTAKWYFNAKGFSYCSFDVEEVVSETLCKVSRYWDRYDRKTSEKAWFSRIATNCASSYMYKETKLRISTQSLNVITKDEEIYEMEYSDRAADVSYNTDTELVSKERISYVREAVSHLGGKVVRIIEMEMEGYTSDEIQEELGISYANLRTIKSRGRARLLEDKEIRSLMKELFGHVA